MYSDSLNHANSCPVCAIATGVGRHSSPPSILYLCSALFRLLAETLWTYLLKCKHVVVFQDLFTKWPMVFPRARSKDDLDSLIVSRRSHSHVWSTTITSIRPWCQSTFTPDPGRMSDAGCIQAAYHPQCDVTAEVGFV